MKTRVSTHYDLETYDFLCVTDQDHVKQVSIHTGGFALTLMPSHMPSLLHAVEVLTQYASDQQMYNIESDLKALLAKVEAAHIFPVEAEETEAQS